MHVKILKQELDFSEQQKLTQLQHMQNLERYGLRMREGLKSLIDIVQQKHEIVNDLFPEGGDRELLQSYHYVMQEIPKLDLQKDLVELPPCSIQTMQQSFYRPFQFNQISSSSQH